LHISVACAIVVGNFLLTPEARMDRRTVLRLAAASGIATAGIVPASAVNAASSKKPGPSGTRDVFYRRWDAGTFATGTFAGTVVAGGALTIATPAGQAGTDDYATWTSPEVSLTYAATEAIASWTATTPGPTWMQVELRGVTEAGTTTKWYVMGRWAADDTYVRRTSVPSQADTDGTIAIDTFVAAAGHGLTRFQVRVTLYRPTGTTLTPQVRTVGAVASKLPAPGSVAPSTPQAAQGVILTVPQYSQNIHAGQYPEYDGGGEAWCSPTSTSMVVASWGTGPTPADYAWVDPSYADPWVDHAARSTYDLNYNGCGNWPFNTAYAGTFGLDGFVTRLRSLNEAERFIAAGIPLVFSLSFKKNQIPGLTYGTNGHLLVLIGFSATGQPILNDPASPDDAAVRKTVGRTEFEAAWLDTSGGVVYVIHPSSVALPTSPAQPNW
jgi:Peptidase_C39 like family